jgi:hypothetical protein
MTAVGGVETRSRARPQSQGFIELPMFANQLALRIVRGLIQFGLRVA